MIEKERLSWRTRASLNRGLCLTTPPVWYAAILALGVVCCVLAHITGDDGLLVGLGSGTVASLLVALLIDVGNTRRKNQTDRDQFERLQGELRTVCRAFPLTLAFLGHIDQVEREESFHLDLAEAFVDAAAADQEGVSRAVMRITDVAEELCRYAHILSANPYFSEEYVKNLTDFVSICRVVGDGLLRMPQDRGPLETELRSICACVFTLFPDLIPLYKQGVTLPM